MPGRGDLESLLSTYGKLTEFKLSRDSRGYTTKEVTSSIVSYLDGLGHADDAPGLGEHWGHFDAFSIGMLSKTQQERTDHMERILLVSACARSLSRSLEPGASRSEEAARLRSLVGESGARRGSGTHLAFLRERLGPPAP